MDTYTLSTLCVCAHEGQRATLYGTPGDCVILGDRLSHWPRVSLINPGRGAREP